MENEEYTQQLDARSPCKQNTMKDKIDQEPYGVYKLVIGNYDDPVVIEIERRKIKNE